MKRFIWGVVAVLFIQSSAWAGEPTTSGKMLGLSSALFAADEAEKEAAVEASTAFAAGTWSFQTYGSVTLGDDAGDLYLAHAGVGYYFIDNLSINFEGVGGITDANRNNSDDDNLTTAGFDLLFRWHFLRGEKWSIYGDGGAGMIWFEEAFPQQGTHQNFTPQAGAGFTWNIVDNINLMAGARWHHISNASRKGSDNNPGFDGIMPYVGIIVPF